MMGGENSDFIPIDLIIEILSRLPAKSILRYRCVSKLWASILLRPYFTELFLKRSSARPDLLFILKRAGEYCFFTSHYPHNSYGQSSLVVSAGFHMKFSEQLWFCGITSGLIYFRHNLVLKEDKVVVSHLQHVICNPSTGQCASFPDGSIKEGSRSYLGFDPIDKQFKILSKSIDDEEPPQILTLRSGNVLWRKIQCPNHFPSAEFVCINGVLYYVAFRNINEWPPVIVCFNIRSEKFKIMDRDFFHMEPYTKLINYKGKLCGITWKPNFLVGIKHERKLRIWFIDDFGELEWLHCSNNLFEKLNKFVDVSVSGMTSTGEVILSMKKTPSKPFCVFYYNPKTYTLRSVEIQGHAANHEAFGNYSSVGVFVDHVEDLNFIK